MRRQYNIGCSGYYYSSWRKKFYPEGLAQKNWLHYYSTIFNTVELNGTFYRTPKLSDLKRYAEVTSKDFTFSVKASRYITHVQRLKDCKKTIAEFQDLIEEGLGGKLSYFLFQMPPSFHYNEENMARVLDSIPHKPYNVVEFRHISWWNKEVQKELKKAKITFCNVDHPGLESWYIHSTPYFYLRLHGNPELFKSQYSAKELKKFSKDFPPGAKKLNVYFNNTYYEAGYTNALQLQKLVSN